LQLFLLNTQGGRAMIVLDTGACRTEISFARTALLGGGLENLHLSQIWRECTFNTPENRHFRMLSAGLFDSLPNSARMVFHMISAEE
jgi:hypothetical protein